MPTWTSSSRRLEALRRELRSMEKKKAQTEATFSTSIAAYVSSLSESQLKALTSGISRASRRTWWAPSGRHAATRQILASRPLRLGRARQGSGGQHGASEAANTLPLPAGAELQIEGGRSNRRSEQVYRTMSLSCLTPRVGCVSSGGPVRVECWTGSTNGSPYR